MRSVLALALIALAASESAFAEDRLVSRRLQEGLRKRQSEDSGENYNISAYSIFYYLLSNQVYLLSALPRQRYPRSLGRNHDLGH